MITDNRLSERSAFSYRVSGDESVSDGVVHAVATVSGTDAAPEGHPDSRGGEVLEPLYEVVDPDALDSLFDPTDSTPADASVQVTFRYHGYQVTVRGDGWISVAPPNP